MADFSLAPPLGAADTSADFTSLYGMVELAHQRMLPGEWEHLVIAAASETSLHRNRLGFESLAFRQRVLVDVYEVDTTTTLLGHKLPMPVVLCPIGTLHTISPTAVVDAAKAASTVGIPIATSSVVKPPLEEIAAQAPGVKFYQLYVRGDSGYLGEQIERAKAAGYKGIVITADSPHFSIRDRPNRSKYFRKPNSETGKDFGAKVTWETMEEIKRLAAPLPVILKGVQTAEDAKRAVDRGVDAIQVSNHGGRELDHCDGTVSVLPEVVAAVGGKIPVILDGGVRRGTDVVKALALGATAVGIGRLYAWALGAGGEAAVQRMLELLGQEIYNTMGLLGVAKIADLDPSYVKAVQPLAGYDLSFRMRDVLQV